MPIVEMERGQRITVPAITLTNGEPCRGWIKASDGESLMIELDENAGGCLPAECDEICVVTWEHDGIQRACPILIRSHTQRSLVAQVVIQERRESPRVRIDMRVVYERVPPTKVKQVADEVMARYNAVSSPPAAANQLDTTDPIEELREQVGTLHDMMQDLMARMDTLMAIIAGDSRQIKDGLREPLYLQNCSSTGIGFVADEPLQQGDYIRLRMELRTVPQTVIECMGVAVRCVRINGIQGANGGDSRFDIGVRFTHIHEGEREALIHYIFKAQRRLLRDLKLARVNMADRN